MFKTLGNLTKSAINVAVTPIAVAADVVTLGGELTDNGESYTGERLRKAKECLDEACEPDKD